MPRDKTYSHIKVNEAIKAEFLEKGFEGASIRSIGARAGMTSAGLYRHYKDKEDMFNAMVDPLIADIRKWTEHHISKNHELSSGKVKEDDLFGESFVDLVRDVILPKKDEFRLLFACSAGTKYENFIHDYVEENQKAFVKALVHLKKNGYPVKVIEEEELHMLLSAYLTACFEPILHDYDAEKTDQYLNTLQDFFMPGWMKIMGIEN